MALLFVTYICRYPHWVLADVFAANLLQLGSLATLPRVDGHRGGYPSEHNAHRRAAGVNLSE